MDAHQDDRGFLFVAEYKKQLPFVVNRVYYITDVTDSTTLRGNHAHLKLRQLMFCVGGSCDIIFDDGCDRITVHMDQPGKAVLVEPGVWREMINFTKNATLIVLASDIYDEADYIRDYKQFINIVKG